MSLNRTIAAITLCSLVASACAWFNLASTEAPGADAAVTSAARDTRPPVTPQEAVPAPPPQAAPPTAPEAAREPAPQAARETIPSPVAAIPAAAPLEFSSLETRLRETKTIGVLTKLSVKNQVDDLLDDFRGYHRQQGTATLPELRRSYDMLLLKVLTLVQDGDPPLAQDIVRSRAAIWDMLADPKKFTESNLMAGVTS